MEQVDPAVITVFRKRTAETFEKLNELRSQLDRLATFDAPVFTPRDCPLGNPTANETIDRRSHAEKSKILWGIGKFRWTCKFCGSSEENY